MCEASGNEMRQLFRCSHVSPYLLVRLPSGGLASLVPPYRWGLAQANLSPPWAALAASDLPLLYLLARSLYAHSEARGAPSPRKVLKSG